MFLGKRLIYVIMNFMLKWSRKRKKQGRERSRKRKKQGSEGKVQNWRNAKKREKKV